MSTFSTVDYPTTNYTPDWISAERYMYCDNFLDDMLKPVHQSMTVFLKKLFHR